jgi:hypothetical protein
MSELEIEARGLARAYQVAAMPTQMRSIERIRAETAIAIVRIAEIEATTVPRVQVDGALDELDRVVDIVELEAAERRFERKAAARPVMAWKRAIQRLVDLSGPAK